MAEQGVIKTLRKMGIQEGDTIKIYGHTFEYYDTDAYEDEELEKAIDTAFPKRHQPKNNGEEE
jgi:GTP-binding protein